jgi:hypothetical protein
VPHTEKLCGSFWWRDIFKLVDDCIAISFLKPVRGVGIILWSDKWQFKDSLEPLSARFPRIFSYVLDQHMSAAELYATQDRTNLFYFPFRLKLTRNIIS